MLEAMQFNQFVLTEILHLKYYMLCLVGLLPLAFNRHNFPQVFSPLFLTITFILLCKYKKLYVIHGRT